MDTAKKLAEGQCENGTWRALCTFLLTASEPMEFLRAWHEGNFEACRREWPEAPEEVYPFTPAAADAPEPVSAALRGLIAAIDAAGYSTEFQGNLARAERALASVPEPVALTDALKALDQIAGLSIHQGSVARELAYYAAKKVRAALAASQPAPVAPFLARDAAELLGVSVPDLSAALVALGMPPRSQGMVIEPLEALAVSRKLSTPVQAKAVAVPEGWKLYALPNDWIPGANLFKDWCGQFFGPDSDDAYLLAAVKSLLAVAAAPTPSKED